MIPCNLSTLWSFKNISSNRDIPHNLHEPQQFKHLTMFINHSLSSNVPFNFATVITRTLKLNRKITKTSETFSEPLFSRKVDQSPNESGGRVPTCNQDLIKTRRAITRNRRDKFWASSFVVKGEYARLVSSISDKVGEWNAGKYQDSAPGALFSSTKSFHGPYSQGHTLIVQRLL